MSVPARKKSRSSIRRRRSHDSLKSQNVGVCQTCQAPLLSHRACKNCGSYKGKQSLDVTREAQRAVKKATSSAHGHDHDHAHDEAGSES